MWVELNATIALVTWDLSITLSNIVETFCSAVILLVLSSECTLSAERISNKLTRTRFAHDVVDVAFVVCLSADTGLSHGLTDHIFTVEALGFLLSSYISGLLTEETFVGGAVSAIIVGRPELEV